MKDIIFYDDAPYTDDATCTTFTAGSGVQGIGLYVAGRPVVDAWLDKGEDCDEAEQALRDMCVLRAGGA